MDELFSIGPKGTVHVFGIKLVGFNFENLGKLIITLAFLGLIVASAWLLHKLLPRLLPRHRVRLAFWTRQGVNLSTALLLIIGVASIWFDDPTRLTTAMGLVTAGLAFALQKVVTSFAGYLVILRGRTFNVGDRIVMGGVRGDVVALGFAQTTIMEMGQPPDVQSAEPAMWVKSRQYTGRLVTVPNSKIFDEPVYNYTRDFDFIWEELALPISYSSDRSLAEQILVNVAGRHQVSPSTLSKEEASELCRRYDVLNIKDFDPKVYYRLTDNWLELSVRFLTCTHGVRRVKDAMSREILENLENAGIGIASATLEIVGIPPLKVLGELSENTSPRRSREAPNH